MVMAALVEDRGAWEEGAVSKGEGCLIGIVVVDFFESYNLNPVTDMYHPLTDTYHPLPLV